MDVRKRVGYAVLVQALLFVFVPINLALIQGKRFTAIDFTNPEVLMNTVNWPVLLIAPLVQFANSIVLLVIAFGLYDVLRAQAPFRMRLSIATSVISSGLLLVSGMNEFMRFFALDVVPIDLQVSTLWTFDLIRFTTRNSAFFAFGCSMLLWGWATYTTNTVPKALSLVILLAGVLGMLIIPFQPLGIAASAVWSLWLAIVFLRPTGQRA
jgi:hypothetical protein